MNERELDAGINPGMALTPFTSRDSNPRPSNDESSTLTTRPDFRPNILEHLSLDSAKDVSENKHV